MVWLAFRSGCFSACMSVSVLVAAFGVLPWSTDSGDALPVGLPGVSIPQVAGGLNQPLYVTHAGDGSGRLFIVEKVGTIKVLQNNVVSTYVSVASKIRTDSERGLLGLAFHPDFENNGKLYISYTRNTDGLLVIEQLTANPPANGLPSSTGLVIITQPHAEAGNHNGGGINFGPDGFLYWATGDGGNACDTGLGHIPGGNSQNKNTLLGKMIRIDVDNPAGGLNYGIPADNPFAGGGGRAEIWAIGLRNPWRWSFDRLTGDLWIGDVGQNVWEEVNYMPHNLPANVKGGRNYGWNGWEGPAPSSVSNCPSTNLIPALMDPKFTPPVVFYQHVPHCSVTGGYVYRGPGNTAIQGAYVYADFCSGFIWASYGVAGSVLLQDTNLLIDSFGEDEAGNLYVVSIGGTVHRLVTV